MRENVSLLLYISVFFILGVPMKELKSVVTRTAECDLETKEIFGIGIDDTLVT